MSDVSKILVWSDFKSWWLSLHAWYCGVLSQGLWRIWLSMVEQLLSHFVPLVELANVSIFPSACMPTENTWRLSWWAKNGLKRGGKSSTKLVSQRSWWVFGEMSHDAQKRVGWVTLSGSKLSSYLASRASFLDRVEVQFISSSQHVYFVHFGAVHLYSATQKQ